MNANDIPTGMLREPPWSNEAEQAVLASLLQDNATWDRVADVVKPADFYSGAHRAVFEAIGRLIGRNHPADIVTVFEAMSAAGTADDAGGLAGLNALQDCMPSAANAGRYAKIVFEKAQRRALIAACDEAVSAVFRGEETAQVLDKVGTLMAQMGQGRQRRGPRLLADLVPQRLDRITDLADGKQRSGLSTGIPTLDRALAGGLADGGVYVLAARPSIGKSSLAQSIGLTVASSGAPVLMLSQEMPDCEVVDRALSSLGGVDFTSLRSGQLKDSEWRQLTDAAEAAAGLPFYVDDQPALRLRDMRAKARQVKGLRLLIVDYLQLSTGEGHNRNEQVEEISRGLKALAKELGLPVLLLSQLNREVEKRPGKEPQLSDLRDSGAIEQDADVVMFLWPIDDGSTGTRLVGIKLDKNRQGPKPRFGLDFTGSQQRWAESYRSIDRSAAGKAGFE